MARDKRLEEISDYFKYPSISDFEGTNLWRWIESHIQSIAAKIANGIAKKLEDKIDGQKSNINALRKDVELLAAHIGVELKTEPKTRKVVKVKKVSKK